MYGGMTSGSREAIPRPYKRDFKTLAGDFEKSERRKIERAYAGLPTEAPAQRIRTVSEALKAYRKGYETGHREKSVSWVKERAAHMERLFGGAILPDLTENRIREYMKARLAEGSGNRTVNMELLCLSRAIGHTWGNSGRAYRGWKSAKTSAGHWRPRRSRPC